LPPGRLLDRYAGLLGTAAEAADPARIRPDRPDSEHGPARETL
jgi:hypothetical protein